jgi:hypothetical protein
MVMFLGILAVASGIHAAALPDAYEGPYQDSLSSTTLNHLTVGTSQTHSLHSLADVDWMICIHANETTALIPYALQFRNLVIPASGYIVIDVFEDGPENPPTITDYVDNSYTTWDTQWLAAGTTKTYCAISAFGTVDPQTSYTVTFARLTGANNGLATVISSSALRVSWSTALASGIVGFNVLRSDANLPTGFAVVNPSPVPLPGGSGWANYDDTGLNGSTAYFYKIDQVYGDLTTAPFSAVPMFAGFTYPVGVPVGLSAFIVE